MVSRRKWLQITAGAALSLNPRVLEALQSQEVITRAIPSTGERLPAVGLGGANTFSRVARAEDFDAVGGVLRALLDGGARVFDTAAGYGASEEASGRPRRQPG
jgi:diketogulonate reductase-like aldo/keto reductase